MKAIKVGLILLITVLQSCTTTGQNTTQSEKEFKANFKDDAKAYFASGCFWCVEAIYEHVSGVKEVYSGYAGGYTKNPTYEASNTGNTGHAESVVVIYDDSKINFKTLVDVYFGSQNISQENGQGPDIGSQYRSIVFYTSQEEKNIIDNKIKNLESSGTNVAAEVKKLDRFWFAEEYHQDYKQKHPNNPYILNVSNPRYTRFKLEFPELIKE